ncbi:unnamed protein product [Rhizophagus irregularis]|nr:unnamed protein product [Rhizophagus irregularis]
MEFVSYDQFKDIEFLAEGGFKLNELKDPNSQDIMIIMPYYDSDIGPVPKNNPNAIYKSRNLSDLIQSAMSLRISRSQSINLEQLNYYQKNNMGPTGKRKYENDLIDNGHLIKRKKLVENENNDYLSKEFEFDIDVKINNNEYITIENDFDINL